MPRCPRICYPGAVYHAVTRGVDKQPIFRDDGDRLAFLALLGEAKLRYGWRIHTYCLMTNHFHLIAETPQANVSRAMQYVNGRFVARFNEKYDRDGHLVERRFWSDLIKTEQQAVRACRYVVLNPVRAGICVDPADWPWSSHRATAGLASLPGFLSLGWTLGHFNGDAAAWRRYVDEAIPAIPVAA